MSASHCPACPSRCQEMRTAASVGFLEGKVDGVATSQSHRGLQPEYFCLLQRSPPPHCQSPELQSLLQTWQPGVGHSHSQTCLGPILHTTHAIYRTSSGCTWPEKCVPELRRTQPYPAHTPIWATILSAPSGCSCEAGRPVPLTHSQTDRQAVWAAVFHVLPLAATAVPALSQSRQPEAGQLDTGSLVRQLRP